MFCKSITSLWIFLIFVTVIQSNSKVCNVQMSYISRESWEPITGALCYIYSNSDRFHYKYSVPPSLITRLENGTEFNYDYTNETSLAFIKPSFLTDYYYELWRSCCREAVECCDNFMTEENIWPTEEYPCPAIWDAWTCFGPAKAGTIQRLKCSSQLYSSKSDVCELKSEKECFSNGTWKDKTNYDVCAIAPVLRNRHNYNVIVLAVATAVCFPAVVIFFSFRTLRKNVRFVLHRNLLSIIVVRNILTIMSKKIVILDALQPSEITNGVMVGNGVACRVLAFFENAAKNGMFACMLADGFYLHKLIVRPFADEPKMVYLYGVVIVLTFLPSLIWATVRGVRNATSCWMVDETQDQWISDGFRIAILTVNLMLLIDIVRVMTMKLKYSNTTRQTKATLKATLFLLPLFGVHIIVITNRNIVPSNTCAAEDIYYYISYLLEGLQGVMVALLFCYISSEVNREFKNLFRKLSLYLQQRRGTNFNKNKDFRRETASTFT